MVNLYLESEVMTKRQGKKTNSQKILEYLQENLGEVSNEELAKEIEINKSNIPREIKKLESQGYNISKRYEQIGRSKYVWFRLTNTQEKQTNSQMKNSKKNVLTPKKSTPKVQAKTIKENRNPQNVVFLEQMSQEVKIFGRTIPINKVREIARKTLEYSRNMIKGIKYYQNAWESRYKRYLEEKPNNFLIDEFESMQKTLDFLKEMNELNEKLKNREGVD